MKNFLIVCIIAIFYVLITPGLVRAEQVDRDVFASVIVNPIFNFSVDNPVINFGYSEPGKTIELGQSSYHNVVKCNSNKGKQWYLKVSILGDVAGPTPTIPLDSFKWKVARSTGEGAPTDGWQALTAEPVIAYASSGNDNIGDDVQIQFKYKLDLPGKSSAGYYKVKLLYTMTDQP